MIEDKKNVPLGIVFLDNGCGMILTDGDGVVERRLLIRRRDICTGFAYIEPKPENFFSYVANTISECNDGNERDQKRIVELTRYKRNIEKIVAFIVGAICVYSAVYLLLL